MAGAGRQTLVRPSLLAAVVCLAWGSTAVAGEAETLYRKGREAERAGQMAHAYVLYSQAAVMDPDNAMYWLRSQAVQSRAVLEAKPKARIATPVEALEEPAGELDPVTEKDLADARKPQPPKRLKAAPGRKDFHLKGNARQLFEEVAKAFGLSAVFDGDYPEAGPTLRFSMEDADYREALRALEAATGSFIVPLSDRLFMAAKDTIQKRREIEPSVTVTVPVPEPVTLQEVQELALAVRQSMEIRRFGIDTQRRVVVMRDAISKIGPARELLESLLSRRAEVTLDLEFTEMNEADALSLGLDLTKTFPVVNFSSIFRSVPSIPEGISRLAIFGGGKTVFGIGLADAQLIARMNRSTARTLMRASVRASDSQPATFHVGDRYPILTAGYYGPYDTSGGDVWTPPPSFNFEDLGLVMKMTPKVHGPDEMSLQIEAEFKVLTGQALNGIPVIAERKLNSIVRLREGEWAVVAGIMNSTEARTISGLAGLSSIPLLGALMSTHDRDRSSNVVVITLKPRILALPEMEAQSRVWRTGTESRPLTPM
jgi:general secretion pathway protein D